MLNLRPYSKEDPFLFHRKIVDTKRVPGVVAQLKGIESQIENQFDNHSKKSLKNKLEDISALSLQEKEKLALLKLYNPRNRKIIDVKNSVTTTSGNRINNLCQYCTINTVGPMDHIMPKASFPEFSVHSSNLLPCCAECNSRKSSAWLLGGNRKFLNLYLDDLPENQYLFVNFVNPEGVIEINYFLENKNGIEDRFFDLIVSHYEKLNLLERFKHSSHSVVSEIKDLVMSLTNNNLEIEEIIATITEVALKEKGRFGQNYWKSILKISLVQNEIFMNSCQNQGPPNQR